MDYRECPHYHHLRHIKRLKRYRGSIYSCLGTALHDACERLIGFRYLNPERALDMAAFEETFDKIFRNELAKLLDDRRSEDPNAQFDKKERGQILKIRDQGKEILPHILPSLDEMIKAKPYHVIGSEMKLNEPINDKDMMFLGWIDLIIKDAEGNVHIIDFKTCSWGWDAKKRSSVATTYQPTLYKHYFGEKFDVEFDRIFCYFALLKRTPGKKSKRVEFIPVKIGKKKVNNALTLVDKLLVAIETDDHPQNWKSCFSDSRYEPCAFFKTEHCIKEKKTLVQQAKERKERHVEANDD
jgi:hypothetical protein